MSECTIKHLVDSGYESPKALSNGYYVAILPFIYTSAIVRISPDNVDFGYDDRWCYHTKEKALSAFEKWDGSGDPDGWHRHTPSNRRRPKGDPVKEYVWE